MVSMTPHSDAIYRVLARLTLTLLTTAGTEMPMTESLSITTVSFKVNIYSVFYGGARLGRGDADTAEDDGTLGRSRRRNPDGRLTTLPFSTATT